MNMRHALITCATVVLLLVTTGCDIMSKNIAVSGPKRYKSEVAAVLGDAKEQLDTDGKLKPATRSKIDSIVTRYEAEFKDMSSMRALKKAQEELDKMVSEPNNAFQHKDQAMYNFAEALKYLETEVRSDAGGG